MKTKQSNAEAGKIEDHPEEWDFRSIEEDSLHLAILYEYARSAEWVVQEFQRWHKVRVKLPNTFKSFKMWNGKSVSDILSYIAGPGENLPFEVGSALWDSRPPYFDGSPFADLIDISILFPLPFQFVGPDLNNLTHLAPQWRQKRTGFKILKSLPQFSEFQRQSDAKAGIFHVPVRIDLNVGNTKLKRDAVKVLVAFAKHSRVTPALKGVAASPPWTHLKELAAYRLHQTFRDVVDAREFLADRQKNHRVSDVNGVLPIYQSSGAWYDAKNNAKKRIQSMYPQPSKPLAHTSPTISE